MRNSFLKTEDISYTFSFLDFLTERKVKLKKSEKLSRDLKKKIFLSHESYRKVGRSLATLSWSKFEEPLLNGDQ